jgi:hypothetical protein
MWWRRTDVLDALSVQTRQSLCPDHWLTAPSSHSAITKLLHYIRAGHTYAFSEMLRLKGYVTAVVVCTPNPPNLALAWRNGEYNVLSWLRWISPSIQSGPSSRTSSPEARGNSTG